MAVAADAVGRLRTCTHLVLVLGAGAALVALAIGVRSRRHSLIVLGGAGCSKFAAFLPSLVLVLSDAVARFALREGRVRGWTVTFLANHARGSV